jgi:hypothetical protein
MQAKLKTFLSLNKGKQENIDNYFNKLSIKSINVTLHCIHPISFRLIYFRFLINLQGKERKVFLAQTTASPKRQPPWATAVYGGVYRRLLRRVVPAWRLRHRFSAGLGARSRPMRAVAHRTRPARPPHPHGPPRFCNNSKKRCNSRNCIDPANVLAFDNWLACAVAPAILHQEISL